nr:DUF2336 domain-containing protein [Methylocystis sp. WRRC1]
MLSDKRQRRADDASILQVIVDQFVERPVHPFSDIKQFERLALGLIDIVDAGAVARVARPLCFHPETPPSIFARLLDKGGPCAELALEYAPALPRAETAVLAARCPTGFALALSRRRDLDREIIAALMSRNEPRVLRSLAGNLAAHFESAARRVLAQAARDDVRLARLLLDRDDLEIDPEPLFLAATRLERTAIILNACRKVLASGYAEPRRADPDFVARLEDAALRRDREEMAALVANALDCRKDRALAALTDSLGEALALTLVALGVDTEAATRIFLCADAPIAHDVDRVRALLRLMRSTPQRAAAQIVTAITGAARTEKEPARRNGSREEAVTAPGWRRSLPRQNGVAARKLDQSA